MGSDSSIAARSGLLGSDTRSMIVTFPSGMNGTASSDTGERGGERSSTQLYWHYDYISGLLTIIKDGRVGSQGQFPFVA